MFILDQGKNSSWVRRQPEKGKDTHMKEKRKRKLG